MNEQKTLGESENQGAPPGSVPRRTRWVFALGSLFVVILWLANQLNLLHMWSPNFAYADVKVSRYMLGRWPASWQEVRDSCQQYFGSDLGANHFEKVELTPMAADTCLVRLHFRNLIGYPYVEEEQLTWTKDEERRIGEDERHSKVANVIAQRYCEWVKEENHGKLTSDMIAIQNVIADWSEVKVKEVLLDNRSSSTGDNPGLKNVPELIIRFSDGEERRVILKEEVWRQSESPNHR